MRDTRRACDGTAFLCFLVWSFSHILWRSISSEADIASGGGGSSGGGGGGGEATPAWVWVDVGIAWAIAPVAGASLQLSLWGSIVPSWLCVTFALAHGLRAEEVRQGEQERHTVKPRGTAPSNLIHFLTTLKWSLDPESEVCIAGFLMRSCVYIRPSVRFQLGFFFVALFLFFVSCVFLFRDKNPAARWAPHFCKAV